MSAILQREPPVKKIEAMLAKAADRVALAEAKVEEIPLEDAEAVVKAENAVATAKAEKAVLERALAGAVAAQKKEAAAQKAREKEARRVRCVARVAVLQPKLRETLVQAAVIAGELMSLQNSLEGADAMAALPALAATEAGKIATKHTRPKVVPTEDAHGRKFDLVTDTRIREVRLDLLCPAVEIE